MTTLLSLALLIAFVATVLAQNCSLCPDNKLPLNGDLVLLDNFGVTFTCNDAVEEMKNASVEECKNFYDAGNAFRCGCPGVEAGPCHGLCLDGSNVPSPERETDSNGTTCAVLDQRIKAIRNESLCAQEAHFNANARSICGCEFTLCEPCLGLYVPDDFLHVSVTLPDGTVTTCGSFQTSILHLNSTQCSMVQGMIGAKCGCPDFRCPLCPGGGDLPLFSKPSEDFTAIDHQCLRAFYFVEGYEPNCTDQTETGYPYLCDCPNAKLPSTAVGCTLCADGILRDPTLTPYDGGDTCEEISFLLSVVDQSRCDQSRASKEAYLCGCSGVEAPTTPRPPIAATLSPTIMVATNNMGGGGGGMGGGGGNGMGGGGGMAGGGAGHQGNRKKSM